MEVLRWISIVGSMLSICVASYSLWLSVKRNKLLAEENHKLKAKHLYATKEIVRLKKLLEERPILTSEEK